VGGRKIEGGVITKDVDAILQALDKHGAIIQTGGSPMLRRPIVTWAEMEVNAGSW